jgi:putative ABC transport system ATP-binding protein
VTGAVGSPTSLDLMTLLSTINADGVTLVVITHDRGIAARLPRIIELRDGSVCSDRLVLTQLARASSRFS